MEIVITYHHTLNFLNSILSLAQITLFAFLQEEYILCWASYFWFHMLHSITATWLNQALPWGFHVSSLDIVLNIKAIGAMTQEQTLEQVIFFFKTCHFPREHSILLFPCLLLLPWTTSFDSNWSVPVRSVSSLLQTCIGMQPLTRDSNSSSSCLLTRIYPMLQELTFLGATLYVPANLLQDTNVLLTKFLQLIWLVLA